MKFIYLFLLAMIGSGAVSLFQAKVWTVDNNTGSAWANFTNLDTAQYRAVNGDTLLISGSPNSYGSFNITKQLKLFGPGYLFAENQIASPTGYSAILGNIQILVSNVTLMGLSFGGITISSGNAVQLQNNIISRCRISSNVTITNSSNIQFTRNLCSGSLYINQSQIPSNIKVIGNYFGGGIQEAASDTSNNSIEIANNIFAGTSRLYQEQLKNCIFTNTAASIITGTNPDFRNNICTGSQLPATNGNQLNVNMNDVFILTGSEDGKFLLKQASPAIGAGLGGVDIGMYGGTDPYVISGLPPIPFIYQMNIIPSGTSESGIPVTVKIRAIN